MTSDLNFENKGKKIGEIPVEINYRIIELFSGGLYSSPNKAFEELVTNSYDAKAQNVCVYVPDEVKKDSVLWVCDNGTSMDSDGLRLLWQIGSSNKRNGESSDRAPIGKFGIGKLATFVLANKLTHICKKDGVIKSVTMHYDKMPKTNNAKTMMISEIILTEEEAKEQLEPLLIKNGKSLLTFNLFGDKSEGTWTIAIMYSLKGKSFEITPGRLKWVLKTALPLGSAFNLCFNGEKLKSSKTTGKVLKKWVFGKNDYIVKREGYQSRKEKKDYFVDLPNIKSVKGFIELYEDSLAKGKSMRVGRSEGIFLKIRGRLINIHNPLLDGMAELHHATLNRVRIEVEADELDKYLTSGRESIKESPAFSDLKKYIEQKFYRTKDYHQKYIVSKDEEKTASFKVSKTSSILSRAPLVTVAKKFLSGQIDNLYLIKIPADLSEDEKESFIQSLEEDLVDGDGKGIIKEIEPSSDFSVEDPIAILDLFERKVKINLFHPFIMNFAHLFKSELPLNLIATTEILTESFLIETGIDQMDVRTILNKRDSLLREFSAEDPLTAPAVAKMIKDSLKDPDALELALYYGFRYLGFETTKLGKSGDPDGKALAYLGINPESKKNNTYSLVYDAKSTEGKKVQTVNVNLDSCVKHKKKYKANYAVVIGIEFQDADKEDSDINKMADQQNVSVIRAQDFWKLILYSIPKEIGPLDLKDLFENNHKITDTELWINNIIKREIPKKPIKLILDTIWELIKEDHKEVPNVKIIMGRNKELLKIGEPVLVDIIRGISQFVPRSVGIDNNGNILLTQSPEIILKSVEKKLEDEMPPEFFKAFENIFPKID